VCGREDSRLIYKLSPGHQYELVKEWKASCATLKTVVFGQFMVWHWRRFSSHSQVSRLPLVHSRWELELLSPRLLRQELRKRAQADDPERVCDWRDKLAGIFEEEPLGLGEDVERIFMR